MKIDSIAFDKSLEIFVGHQGYPVASVDQPQGQSQEGLDVPARTDGDDPVMHVWGLAKYRGGDRASGAVNPASRTLVQLINPIREY